MDETANVGDLLGIIQANDPDHGSSGVVRYSIDSGNEGDQFTLDDTNGHLMLRQPLDYENKHSYR